VTFTISEFQAPPLINYLIGRNGIIDTRIYLSLKGGRTHVGVEYSAIIRAPLRGGYKRGEEKQRRGRMKLERERYMRERREYNLRNIEVLLGLQVGNSAIWEPFWLGLVQSSPIVK